MALHLHIAKPLEILAGMLSESTAAQTLLGVADSEEAAEKIFYAYAEDEEYESAYEQQQPKAFPRLLVGLSDFNSEKSTTSSWDTTVSIDLLFDCVTLEADKLLSLSDRYYSFCERVEAVADSLRDMAATGTRLNITKISTVDAPQRANPKLTRAIGELWLCTLGIEVVG